MLKWWTMDPASIDCGSCIHFHQPHGSLLGVCHNEKMRFKTQKPMKLGAYEEETT